MSKIDLTRHLCESCTKCDICEYTECELGEMANVIRCRKYNKRNANNDRPRAVSGGTYYHMVLVFNGVHRGEKAPKKRIDNRSTVDNILYESGNYFLNESDCVKRINELNK